MFAYIKSLVFCCIIPGAMVVKEGVVAAGVVSIAVDVINRYKYIGVSVCVKLL